MRVFLAVLLAFLLLGCSASKEAPQGLPPAVNGSPEQSSGQNASTAFAPVVQPDLLRAELTVRKSGDLWLVRIDRILEQNASAGAEWAHLREGDEVEALFFGKYFINQEMVKPRDCPQGSVPQVSRSTAEALWAQQGDVMHLDDGSYTGQVTYGFLSDEDEAAKHASATFRVDVPIDVKIEQECVKLTTGP